MIRSCNRITETLQEVFEDHEKVKQKYLLQLTVNNTKRKKTKNNLAYPIETLAVGGWLTITNIKRSRTYSRHVFLAKKIRLKVMQ